VPASCQATRNHCSKHGDCGQVKKCTLLVTGASKADVIFMERAVFRRRPDKGFMLGGGPWGRPGMIERLVPRWTTCIGDREDGRLLPENSGRRGRTLSGRGADRVETANRFLQAVD